MKIYYRISDSGYNKVKPEYVNNENCLRNFCNVFFDYIYDINILADNCSDDTISMIKKYIDPINIEKVSIGHGAGTFNLVLDKALKLDDSEIVYFVENDYIHVNGSPKIIEDMINLGETFATLYLHPDKFIPPAQGGNPEVDEGGGYLTRIYRGKTQLYGMFNSTTMTFASRVSTLRKTETILRKHTSGTHPNDFLMFLELREKGYPLICPLNAFSTHGETMWLSPLPNVEKENLENEWKNYIFNS